MPLRGSLCATNLINTVSAGKIAHDVSGNRRRVDIDASCSLKSLAWKDTALSLVTLIPFRSL